MLYHEEYWDDFLDRFYPDLVDPYCDDRCSLDTYPDDLYNDWWDGWSYY